MTEAVLSLLGGVGLFLFGMQAMTGGLRALSGQQLRAVLRRFTTSPLTGALTGAGVTAVLQSSSATIMAVIGFVGAGLMTFPQAVGVILGANVGTTITGWMVAVFGLKLQLSDVAMPVLFGASLLAMLGRNRWAQVGTVLSGLSLLFIGLGMMQGATGAIEPLLSGHLVSAEGIGGRIALVLMGTAFTVVTQASGAGVAAVIVLLAGGAVDLVQAASLVIGMDIGTTAKAWLSTLGGSRDMRRTAYAHVGYNLLTGVIGLAVVTLTPMLLSLTGGDEATALTLFHTMLNVVGVIVILPFVGQAEALIERLVPAAGAPVPEPLDQRLLAEPLTALDAALVSARRIAAARFTQLADRLTDEAARAGETDLRPAIEDLEGFLAAIAIPGDHGGPRNRLAALLHLTDHLNRLDHRGAQTERIAALRSDLSLVRPARALAALLRHAAADPAQATLAMQASRLHRLIRARVSRLRQRVLDRDPAVPTDPHDLFLLTDSLRWAERVAAHVARILAYVAAAARDNPSASEARGEGPRA